MSREQPIAPVHAWRMLIEALDLRFEYDSRGRIVKSMNEGELPRFVLGRAVLGCLWRIRGDVPPHLVGPAADLAGRESGFSSPLDGAQSFGQSPSSGLDSGGREVSKPSRPERLVMLERLFGLQTGTGSPGAEAETRHEWVRHGGVPVAELWLIP